LTLAEVQSTRVLLVTGLKQRTVVERVAQGAAFSTLRLAWLPIDLPEQVEVVVAIANSSSISSGQLSYLEADQLGGLRVLVGEVRQVVDIVRIVRRVLGQLVGAVSELQARRWWCQLRQQLGLFFRRFFDAPLRPSVAVLPPLLAAVVVGRS
jgi:hypothetical protein